MLRRPIELRSSRHLKDIISTDISTPPQHLKISPTAAHPVRPADGGRAFYQPEVMARRPLSVSPTPQQTTTHVHYGTPKTHGTLSPSLRGVPSSVNYGVGHHTTTTSSSATVTARPVQVHQQHQPQQHVIPVQQHSPNPPPMPSNPPPESRVPASVRGAVSPRRATKPSRQWPPEKRLPTIRFWQIDPATQYKEEKEDEPTSLQELIEAGDKENSSTGKSGTRKKKTTCALPQIAEAKVFERETAVKSISVVIEDNDRKSQTEICQSSPSTKPIIQNGIHWTIVHGPSSPELRAQYPREDPEVPERPVQLASEVNFIVPSTECNSDDVPPKNNLDCLHPPETIDSSTSPIPTIELPRRRSGTSDSSGIIRALSPVPFKRTPSPIRPMTEEEPTYRLDVAASNFDSGVSLVGVNTTPRPFTTRTCSPSPVPTVEQKPQRTKPLKKVDFSKATIIPEPWSDACDVVDEADILAQESPISPMPVVFPTDKEVTYDGDESELYDNKSDVASTTEMETVDEHEQWMREELELARKEELAELGNGVSSKEEWRQQAMSLLNDDTQMERDIAMVAALNERLQGLKDMEESDRLKAIECIERHQSNLEDQQDQLSALLDSAIAFLKNLGTSQATSASPNLSSPNAKDEGVCLENNVSELSTGRFKGPGDVISETLERICADDGQSFARSTFEQHTEQRTTTGGPPAGPPPPAKPVESRTHSSMSNTGGRVPFCEACKQQIRQVLSTEEGAFVLATGLAWCPDHFVCAYRGCGRRLLECGFVEENGSKYCEGEFFISLANSRCFEAHIAPRCSKCSKPIISDCVNAMQKKWHPTCFTCAHCYKPFGNAAFYLENGLPYCEQDWNMLFTTKCVSCKYPIEAGDRWVEALGNAYHSNCFNCTRCHSNLEGESFFAKNGQPYCKMHA
ncbi:unnamed protein product [Nippostrongylus brasiliensis]|uniref:PDZ and LIM domain protein Zasp (inferred by orthology to a D. melanogaster protein) n=1 Tax=Nippostrongylus brasiliensis TaxID=27835 RepID=A0A0N4Y135_NIPBR|nr:unnamed protein product [Nippostrongylus brasiliensis]